MAGTLTVPTRNKLLDGLKLKTIKLHSADPTDGTTGVIAGASKDFTVAAAAGGSIASNVAGGIQIDVTVVSGTVVVSHYSLWDDGVANAGTPVLLATGALSASQNYTATGKYIVNTLTVDLNKV